MKWRETERNYMMSPPPKYAGWIHPWLFLYPNKNQRLFLGNLRIFFEFLCMFFQHLGIWWKMKAQNVFLHSRNSMHMYRPGMDPARIFWGGASRHFAPFSRCFASFCIVLRRFCVVLRCFALFSRRFVSICFVLSQIATHCIVLQQHLLCFSVI